MHPHFRGRQSGEGDCPTRGRVSVGQPGGDAPWRGPQPQARTRGAAEPAALRLVTRNITPAKMMGFTVASPGDLASMVQIEAAGSEGGSERDALATTLAELAARLPLSAVDLSDREVTLVLRAQGRQLVRRVPVELL